MLCNTCVFTLKSYRDWETDLSVPLKSQKGNYFSKIQKNAGLIICDNTLLWSHWPHFMQPTGETWTWSDESRNGNTAAHGAAEKDMCHSQATKFQRNREIGVQQGTERRWKKQFLCSVTTEQSVVWMVMSPWKHWFKGCQDTGPCPAGLTEIETICYLSTEWIWTHLFIVTLHIL